MQSLVIVLQHAESERDAALAVCQRARADERAAAAQADQLIAYRDDYEQRWRERFGRGGAMTIVSCYQSFSARLGQAIEQQQRQLQQLAAARQRAEALLVEGERRVAVTAKLIERRRDAEAQTAARRERKHDDELAARLALARGTAPPPAFSG